MDGRTAGSWNAMPSLKPSYTCPTRVFTFSTLISRSPRSLLSSSLRIGLLTRRVPPSISFCLSSKLESLSSLFVFRRLPLHSPSLTLAMLLLPPSSLRPSVLPPSSPPFLSAITVSFLSFLSFFDDVFYLLRRSLFLSFLGLFPPLPFLQLEVLILFTTLRERFSDLQMLNL